VVIRDAEDKDLSGLEALEARSFASDRMSRRSLRRLIGRDTACLRVAISAGCLVGYYLVLFRHNSLLARLYSIAVDSRSRGAGVGHRLLADAERVAARRGCRALRLEVRVGNRAAIGLYERRAFRRIGRYSRYYADGADALRFQKPLSGRRRSRRRGGEG
jgi:ribosomal protein S18 acetylase RimI-like enzyme